MAGANDQFVRGQNVVFKLRQDGAFIYILGKNWSVEENATEVADDVNGEDRSRLDKVTNYFSGEVEVFMKDQSVLQKYIDAQDVRDAAGLTKAQSAALQIKHRDGTAAAYLLQEAVFGPFSTGSQGRADAVMVKIKVRFRYFKPMIAIA